MADKRNETISRVGIAGALLAGFGAAACCLGPLLLAALGLAGGGLLVIFEPYRPFFIAAAVVALGAGFWFSYRAPTPTTADGEACDCELPRAARVGRAMLWVATAVVALFIASPYLISWLASAPVPITSATALPRGLTAVLIPVEGMTCESCEVTIRTALMKVPGVAEAKVDATAGSALVSYLPEEVQVDALVESINSTGYKAGTPTPR